MRTHYLILAMLLLGSASNAEPQIEMTYKSSSNGHGTVAGRILGRPSQGIGITVSNGSLRYSTIPDPQGNWAIVFRHLAVNFTVTAWDASSPDTVLQTREETLDFADAAPLPWTRYARGVGDSHTEYLARTRAEDELDREIRNEERRCRNDQGRFSHSFGFLNCQKLSANRYVCRKEATCYCR